MMMKKEMLMIIMTKVGIPKRKSDLFPSELMKQPFTKSPIAGLKSESDGRKISRQKSPKVKTIPDPQPMTE